MNFKYKGEEKKENYRTEIVLFYLSKDGLWRVIDNKVSGFEECDVVNVNSVFDSEVDGSYFRDIEKCQSYYERIKKRKEFDTKRDILDTTEYSEKMNGIIDIAEEVKYKEVTVVKNDYNNLFEIVILTADVFSQKKPVRVKKEETEGIFFSDIDKAWNYINKVDSETKSSPLPF